MKERNKSILRGSDKPYLDPLPKQTRTRDRYHPMRVKEERPRTRTLTRVRESVTVQQRNIF